MRVVFVGTPDFTIPVLTSLHAEDCQVVAVYTKPDRRAGRGRHLMMSPVKQWALEKNLPVEQPTVWDEKAAATLHGYQPDMVIVMAYGMLLPSAILSIPPLGCINVHLSLLPRWRGAAPLVRAIEYGDSVTGVSLMQMQEELDAGPIISRKECDIVANETTATLQKKLSFLAGELLAEFLTEPRAQLAAAVPQSEDGVCYAHKLTKEEAWIDWNLSAVEIARKVRAFNPAPVAQTVYHDTILRIWEAQVQPEHVNDSNSPGYIAGIDADGLIVRCGRDKLLVSTVQPAGKRIMSAADFACGHKVIGEYLTCGQV